MYFKPSFWTYHCSPTAGVTIKLPTGKLQSMSMVERSRVMPLAFRAAGSTPVMATIRVTEESFGEL